MYINPTVAIDRGWITFPEWMSEKQRVKCIQPNAIDFTLDTVNLLDIKSPGIIRADNTKTFKNLTLLNPDPGYYLSGGSVYDLTSDFHVTVPDDVVCELAIRSTFSRMGCLFGNGIYDTGFSGNIGCVMHCLAGDIETEPRTRVGQIKFLQADSHGQYAGGYNTKPGDHWSQSNNAKGDSVQ